MMWWQSGTTAGHKAWEHVIKTHTQKHVDSRLPLLSDAIEVPPMGAGYQKCAAGKFTANKVPVLQYGVRGFRFKHLILTKSQVNCLCSQLIVSLLYTI
jgi:hypothetical protein